MNRRTTIDKINSKYRGSGIVSHQHGSIVGGTIGHGNASIIGHGGLISGGGLGVATTGVTREVITTGAGLGGAVVTGAGLRGSAFTGAGFGAAGYNRTIRRSSISPGAVIGGPSVVLPAQSVSVHPVGGAVVTSALPVATGQVLTSGIPFTNNQTIIRRSRVDVYPSTSVVAPAPIVTSIVNPPVTHYVAPAPAQVVSTVVDDQVNLPPPPPIERTRNRPVGLMKQRGFFDRCPWWCWLLLGLLGLLALLGLLFGLRSALFGSKS